MANEDEDIQSEDTPAPRPGTVDQNRKGSIDGPASPKLQLEQKKREFEASADLLKQKRFSEFLYRIRQASKRYIQAGAPYQSFVREVVAEIIPIFDLKGKYDAIYALLKSLESDETMPVLEAFIWENRPLFSAELRAKLDAQLEIFMTLMMLEEIIQREYRDQPDQVEPLVDDVAKLVTDGSGATVPDQVKQTIIDRLKGKSAPEKESATPTKKDPIFDRITQLAPDNITTIIDEVAKENQLRADMESDASGDGISFAI